LYEIVDRGPWTVSTHEPLRFKPDWTRPARNVYKTLLPNVGLRKTIPQTKSTTSKEIGLNCLSSDLSAESEPTRHITYLTSWPTQKQSKPPKMIIYFSFLWHKLHRFFMQWHRHQWIVRKFSDVRTRRPGDIKRCNSFSTIEKYKMIQFVPLMEIF
jgi:hypothetical protein